MSTVIVFIIVFFGWYLLFKRVFGFNPSFENAIRQYIRMLSIRMSTIPGLNWLFKMFAFWRRKICTLFKSCVSRFRIYKDMFEGLSSGKKAIANLIFGTVVGLGVILILINIGKES